MRMLDDQDFISLLSIFSNLRKNKLYHELTKIIIEKSFTKFQNLPYMVSINISVEDILNKEIYSFIIAKLDEFKIGNKVVFEIIESEGIENFDQVISFINEVKTYGSKISIDDFGTDIRTLNT